MFIFSPLERRGDLWNDSTIEIRKANCWNSAQFQERELKASFYLWLINRLCSLKQHLLNTFYGLSTVLGAWDANMNTLKLLVSWSICFKNKLLHMLSDGKFLIQLGLHCKMIFYQKFSDYRYGMWNYP